MKRLLEKDVTTESPGGESAAAATSSGSSLSGSPVSIKRRNWKILKSFWERERQLNSPINFPRRNLFYFRDKTRWGGTAYYNKNSSPMDLQSLDQNQPDKWVTVKSFGQERHSLLPFWEHWSPKVTWATPVVFDQDPLGRYFFYCSFMCLCSFIDFIHNRSPSSSEETESVDGGGEHAFEAMDLLRDFTMRVQMRGGQIKGHLKLKLRMKTQGRDFPIQIIIETTFAPLREIVDEGKIEPNRLLRYVDIHRSQLHSIPFFPNALPVLHWPLLTGDIRTFGQVRIGTFFFGIGRQIDLNLLKDRESRASSLGKSPNSLGKYLKHLRLHSRSELKEFARQSGASQVNIADAERDDHPWDAFVELVLLLPGFPGPRSWP